MTPLSLRVTLVSVSVVFAVSACSGPGEPTGSSVEVEELVDTTAVVADPAPIGTAVLDTARDAVEELEVTADGSATLTIGDRVWEFPAIACLYGEDAAQVEATFALSGVADGHLLYLETTPEGDVISIEDIAGEADLPVSMTAKADATGATSFVRVDDRDVTATADFLPVDQPDGAPIAGELVAECGPTANLDGSGPAPSVPGSTPADQDAAASED